jgi:hypothetical protein
MSSFTPLKGHCYCQQTAYTINAEPIVAYTCHCHNCQTRSGSAFALQMLIEQDNLTPAPDSKDAKIIKTSNDPDTTDTIASCAFCGTILWSIHPSFFDGVCCVRAGTIENADKNVKPTAHLFARSKHPWITLPEGSPAFEAFPGPEDSFLSQEGFQRAMAAVQKAKEAKAAAKKA